MTIQPKTRLIAFGPASVLTRGAEKGTIPETDFGVYPAQA